MTKVENVPLCPTCPARGLCVGNVAIETVPLIYKGYQDEYGYTVEGFPGVGLTATDKDGISYTMATYTPTSTGAQRMTKSGVDSKTVETNPRGGKRNDRVFNALRTDSESMLTRVALRAQECVEPYDQHVYFNNGEVYHQQVCRAVSQPVLDALAKHSFNNLT